MKNDLIAITLLIVTALIVVSIAVKLIGHALDKEFKNQDNIVLIHKQTL